jgi:hypothetical protein
MLEAGDEALIVDADRFEVLNDVGRAFHAAVDAVKGIVLIGRDDEVGSMGVPSGAVAQHSGWTVMVRVKFPTRIVHSRSPNFLHLYTPGPFSVAAVIGADMIAPIVGKVSTETGTVFPSRGLPISVFAPIALVGVVFGNNLAQVIDVPGVNPRAEGHRRDSGGVPDAGSDPYAQVVEAGGFIVSAQCEVEG